MDQRGDLISPHGPLKVSSGAVYLIEEVTQEHRAQRKFLLSGDGGYERDHLAMRSLMWEVGEKEKRQKLNQEGRKIQRTFIMRTHCHR